MVIKSKTSCADKMLVWIDRDVHKILRKDAFETETTIGNLASIAIREYYRKMSEVSGEKSVQRFL